MKAIITPSIVHGAVNAPASKSSMQRACAAALLSHGTTTILRPGNSNDDLAAIDVITKLGASVTGQDADKLVIKSDGVKPISDTLNCGESGLGIRMFTPLAALSSVLLTIDGSGSLVKRPMHFFDEIFPLLGIKIGSNSGYLPIRIQGPLQPSDIQIDGSLSSQFLTGLLMAFAAAGAKDVEIKVQGLRSRPYIDLTLDVMKQFGVAVEHDRYEHFRFTGSGSFTPRTYTVEGDWSGGAFLLVAGAVAGKIRVEGLSLQSTQADKAIMQALTDAGAQVETASNSITIAGSILNAFDFDATDCPDLFPPLVALASYCKGETVIRGVSRLAHKESNRGLTLQEEFAKMGVRISLQEDIMKIEGSEMVRGAVVHSRHDHRIAMACAIAGLKASGETTIEEAEAVNKSFPDFYDRLVGMGAKVKS